MTTVLITVNERVMNRVRVALIPIFSRHGEDFRALNT